MTFVVVVLLAFWLLFYLSMSYFIYMFVEAKRKTVFEGLSGIKKLGIFLVLPIVTVTLFLYHILTKNKETQSNESTERNE